jgi:trk system potassium uptake protein TrkH
VAFTFIRWKSLSYSAAILVIAFCAFFYEEHFPQVWQREYIGQIFDWLLIALIFLDTWAILHKKSNLKLNSTLILISFILLAFYLVVFIDIKFFNGHSRHFVGSAHGIIILRTIIIYILALNRDERSRRYFSRLLMQPAHTMALSFLAIGIIGSLLLNMPFLHHEGVKLPYIDLLFMSISAVCITGLTTVNIVESFNIWGQIVIMLLVQIGGIGIMLISYIGLSGRRLSMRSKALLAFMLSDEDIISIGRVSRNIIVATFLVEAVGAVFFTIGFSRHFGFSPETLFSAIFHSVTSFCNAGMSVYLNNFEIFRADILINVTSMALIIIGGLGFSVVFNIRRQFRNFLFNLLHKRKEHKRVDFSLNTVISVRTTFILIFVGFVLFYLLEHNGVLRNISLKEQYLVSLFQSVTLRTAGFNTIDTSQISFSTILFMMVFMFIGGAAGGTAGGVKTTTFVVACAGILSFIRGRSKTEIGRYSISDADVYKAYTVILMSLVTIIAAAFILSLTEHLPFQALIFKIVSAISTTGYAVSDTGQLSLIGKLIIILLMFIGRLGPMTIFIVGQERVQRRVKTAEYPQGQILIG